MDAKFVMVYGTLYFLGLQYAQAKLSMVGHLTNQFEMVIFGFAVKCISRMSVLGLMEHYGVLHVL